MPITVSGLPYPVGTDKVVAGDDAIMALAKATEIMVQGALAILTTNNGGDFNITFTRPFKAGTIPSVMVAHADAQTTALFMCTVYDTLTTNLVAPARIVTCTTGAPVLNGAVRLRWIAVGVAP